MGRSLRTCSAGGQVFAGSRHKMWPRRRCVAAKRKLVQERSIQVKVRKLQRLVPGGSGLPADHLFTRTADYILFLKMKLGVLQALSKMYQL
ncbi:hypothetical protein EJ110_NYTH12421 [Nymphaea thermarum]|nr:hypothetical protein EJ110_NYTH12421 [Nymphaea thermarum]